MSKRELQNYRQDKYVWIEKYEEACRKKDEFMMRRASEEIQRINEKIEELLRRR